MEAPAFSRLGGCSGIRGFHFGERGDWLGGLAQMQKCIYWVAQQLNRWAQMQKCS